MQIEFTAQQRKLSLSECERLCVKFSRDVVDLAARAGWRALTGEPLNVPVGYAINMMVFSSAKDAGVEAQSMGSHLPGIRNEALLKLGEDIDNWSWAGSADARQSFFNRLYGTSDVIRPRIAPLLGCCPHTTTRRLRFHSQADVESLSNQDIWQSPDPRTPRFTIDAHDFANRIQGVCGGPLFVANSRQHAF